ncbi:hypothetical protein SCP_0504540 [Sparassis crispa]|uniref:Uncharacterized protein n=1 Tax=Sparassis crispa TaxID=139825 RepID=A0A401GMH3_9APHY|nr:hypothetical protein SCP_0504540 [Sparassis crispa]GBE83406.1 hypothetical protein SCP_0504540 [Sparassis crispa]
MSNFDAGEDRPLDDWTLFGGVQPFLSLDNGTLAVVRAPATSRDLLRPAPLTPPPPLPPLPEPPPPFPPPPPLLPVPPPSHLRTPAPTHPCTHARAHPPARARTRALARNRTHPHSLCSPSSPFSHLDAAQHL